MWVSNSFGTARLCVQKVDKLGGDKTGRKEDHARCRTAMKLSYCIVWTRSEIYSSSCRARSLVWSRGRGDREVGCSCDGVDVKKSAKETVRQNSIARGGWETF